MDEFRAFVDHFNPQIFFAAVNAFREGTNLQPTGWEEDFFLIKVERRPNPSPLSPRWARFMITHAKRYSIEDFEAVWGAEYEKPGNARAADVKKANSRGAGHGVITRAQAIGRMNTDPFVFPRDAVEKVSSGSPSNSSKPV
ncbi:hypothetical protein PHLCEN_2v7768 [Hermanssonia centrifuga]|uniref:Uncharacterized protein n=1 Tax=Hermanssonia centrifuga TaxID=98765 RepID=A0A2R6NVH0_9APHY|nr:hypothetical protein PHLCEN_2v7768 [Hermanssonia centrifuga]